MEGTATAATDLSEIKSADCPVDNPSKEEDSEDQPVDLSEPEVEPKKAPEPQEGEKEPPTSNKELSWEKIAAEISEDDVENNQAPAPKTNDVEVPEKTVSDDDNKEESETTSEVKNEQKTEDVSSVKDTVINSVSDESNTEKVEDVNVNSSVDKVVEDEPVIEEKTAEEKITDESVEEQETTSEEKVTDESIEEQETTSTATTVEEVTEKDSPEVEISAEVAEDSTHEEENDVIEITELKPEETTEVVDSSNEVEYTVIEAEDVETNEIIEEHLAQTNNTTETVVIINPDQTQTEVTIEQVNENVKRDGDSQTTREEIYLISNESLMDDPSDEPEVKDIKPKKQRGRKPISDIPLHVLGRDITKPTEGVSNGGRTMPKPRLGVKVPYRNLTSQIVSKEEIEKEIMERFKLKQEQNSTSSGDILFARKLTQRLAKKLIPSEREKPVTKPQDPTTSVQCTPEPKPTQPVGEIKNNSDLIAILEGDGDDITLDKQKEEEPIVVELPKDVEKKEVIKSSEKEIALQQLKELPVGKNKIFKTRSQQEEDKKPPINPLKDANKLPKNPSAESSTSKPVEKKQLEVEPRLKTGMVIKTYTRKRKSSESEQILPPKKSVMVTTIKTEDGGPPTNVYITKSSRVIKRKVIWDPDEVPPRSPVKSPKPDIAKSPKSDSVKSPKSDLIKSPKVEVVKSPKPEVSSKPTAIKPAEKKTEAEKSPEKKSPIAVKKMISKSPPIKKPKRLTEVDKLLMDEGAVNMIYDVKNNDDSSQDKIKKKNKSVISLDKAHKELMSKTNVIKNDLQQNTNKEVQKSLRKKEVGSPPKKEVPSPKKEAVPSTVTRKKSKDSARSSVHSPPASPPYNAAEASRIIRRHSSSSFSSNDELNEEGNEERVTRKRSAVMLESPKKKMKKSSDVKSTKNNNNTVTDSKVNHVDTTLGQYKTLTATKKDDLVSIKLNAADTKCFFTEQVLKELTSCLKDLSKDDDCLVVSITSDSDDTFCQGLDYSYLVSDDENIRKKKATELSSVVKEYLRCLLHFPKVLVAGIQGDCIGLGVTMLPLFDMVIASDTSTFSTPYTKLGCIAEGGFLLTVPHLNSHGLASELLYTSQVIKADDAFRRGLVTRLCWPEKYHEELEAMLTLISSQSKQSIVATKQQLRHHILQSTESSLNSVTKVLIEHWTSPECQKNFLK